MKHIRHFLAGIAILVFMTAPSISAGIIYVKSDAAGLADGTSWDDAYTDLQPAIDAALSGDQIWVAQAVYHPTAWPNGGSTDEEKHFTLKNGVSIYGGFVGTETALDDRDPSANVTTLSGDLQDDDVVTGSGSTLVITVNTVNAYHVLYHPVGTNLDASAVLDGFTITGGNAVGAGPALDGAGMYNEYCNPVIRNCIFTANNAGRTGGAVKNTNSSPSFWNCTFSLNLAANSGGGIDNTSSNPTFERCLITGNASVADWGGGVSNDNSAPLFEDCTISDNAAPTGGGIYGDFADFTLTRCTISTNSVTVEGGGIAIYDSLPTITNCTIYGNSAADGGGIFSGANSSATLMNCTVSANNATGFGGGIDNANATSMPVITNSIFWNNIAANNPEISGGTPTVTFSIVQGGYAGTGNLLDDPVLGALQDNGGHVFTVDIDASSPALDVGTATGAPIDDARGFKRDATPDIGAVEVSATPSYTVTFVVSGYGHLTGDTQQTVFAGEDATPVTAVPNTSFVFSRWTSGGVDYSTDNPLTVTSVVSDMTLTAVFAFKTYTFTSSATSGGEIYPRGMISVPEGASQTYSIVPDYGFGIKNVLVDGVSVGRVSSYTFTNADQNHSISVDFFVLDRDSNGSCRLGSASSSAVNLSLLLLLCSGLFLRSSVLRRRC